MNFLAPTAFFFAFAIPVVVVFYLLKRKRVVKLVASTLLWQKFLAETQASAPFQRLRKNWLLLLQILLLLLAVLALARPYFSAKVRPAKLRVVILDVSASMQATDESPSRFEKARAEALKWVDTLQEDDQMVILQAGANTEVLQSATSEKAALRRALQGCACSDGPTSLTFALKMAESLVKPYKDAEIHLFSDGAVADLNEFENKGLPLVFHPVGKGVNNLGITALDVRANPEDPRQRAIYACVVNFSSNTFPTELELSFDQHVLQNRVLTIPAGETSPQVFLADQSHDGVFTVRLTSKDDLPADNQASIVSLLPKPVKVLMVSRGNRRLEKALRAVPNVELAVVSELTDSAAPFDFVVLDDVTPAVWPQGNLLAIHVVNTNWFENVTRVEAPALVDWRTSHPLLRAASFDNVQIAESLAAKAPPWAVSVLDSSQAPLILAGDLGRQRIVWIGFDVLESNWPLRISFPTFFVNAVEWLNPANARNSQLLIKSGDAFRQTLGQPVKTAQVVVPGGATRTLELGENATEVVFGDTLKQGVYHLRVGTNDTTFCVNLLDAAESNIKPHDAIKLGKYTVTASTLQHANTELWRNIAALALLMLLIEWWYYHPEDGVMDFPIYDLRFTSESNRPRPRYRFHLPLTPSFSWVGAVAKVPGTASAVLFTTFLLLLCAVLTGCAKSKVEVIAYCAQDQGYAEPIFADFQKETGIRVKAVYDNEAVKTVALANRLLAERNHPRCDVFWGNEEMRTRQLAAQNIFRATNGWAAFGFRSRRLVINTNRVSLASAPRSLTDLTNETWRGKVALAYPQFGTTATHFHALCQFWGEASWQTWCRALVANKPFLLDGNSMVVKMVGRGDAWVGLTDSDDIADGQREGLPIQALPMTPNTLLIPNTVAVIRDSPHPEAAERLFAFLQRPEVVQRLVAAKALEGISTTGVSGTTLKVSWEALLRDLEPTTAALCEIFLR